MDLLYSRLDGLGRNTWVRKYFRHEICFFRAFKEAGFEPGTIYDVGSSNSGWSLQLSEIFPAARFHLFEPLVDDKAFYRENTERVLQDRPDFRIHKVAVGDRDGTAKMGVDEDGYASSILVTQTNEMFTQIVEVPVRRLDTIAFELGLPRPEILKMDVQGSELAVLTGSGSVLDNVQIVQAEIWFLRWYGEGTPLISELSEILQSKGFLLVAFGDFFYGNSHELLAADAFFVRKELLDRLAARLPKSGLTAHR